MEIEKLDKGKAHDEVKWTDVAVHACTILNQKKKVVFLSSADLERSRDMVDHARADGYELIVLPENIRAKLRGLRDATGAAVRSLDVFTTSSRSRASDPPSASCSTGATRSPPSRGAGQSRYAEYRSQGPCGRTKMDAAMRLDSGSRRKAASSSSGID